MVVVVEQQGVVGTGTKMAQQGSGVDNVPVKDQSGGNRANMVGGNGFG